MIEEDTRGFEEFGGEDQHTHSNRYQDENENGQSEYRKRFKEGVIPKKKHRSSSKKGRKKTDSHDEDPDRRAFHKTFHQNRENQRWERHNSKMPTRKQQAKGTASAKRRSSREATKKATKNHEDEWENASDDDDVLLSDEETAYQDEEEQVGDDDPPSEDDDPPSEEDEEDLYEQTAAARAAKRNTPPKDTAGNRSKPKAKAARTTSKGSPNSVAGLADSGSNSSQPRRGSTNPERAVANPNAKDRNSGGKRTETGTTIKKPTKEELELQVARLTKRSELALGKPARKLSATDTKLHNAYESLVLKIVKHDLFQVCKFLSGHKNLRKACLFVMRIIDKLQLVGLEGAELAEYEEEWYYNYENLVRTGINLERSYCHEQCKKFMKKVFLQGEEANWPTDKNIERLALRLNIKGDEDWGLLVKYWEFLLVKTTGMGYWSPTKRQFGCISSMREPEGTNLNAGLLVHYTDEAFLVWIFENNYHRWQYDYDKKALQVRLNDKQDKEMTQKKFDELQAVGKAGKYTTAVAGRKPFGGITPKGEARWKELSTAIRENRANNAEKIREIEERALGMVREFTKRIEKEAKKKANGKKKPKEKEEEEEEPDMDDMDNF